MNRFVLMLEGDGDDRYITQQTLSELNIDIPIKFSPNSTGFFRSLQLSDKPSLILIDYNSTPENGLEVLKKLKSNSAYSDVPVVILSDSDHPKYKNECYKFGASSFIKKPDTVEATNKKIASFFNYWFNVVEI
jgi:DNA-binding NarL/FixJ family response regulator